MPAPGNPSGNTGINPDHLEKLQINKLIEQLNKISREEVLPGFNILEQLSDALATIKDIEHFETLGKPPKPSENIFKTLGLNREEGYKTKKVGSKTIEAHKQKLRTEIQKNPQITAKINETLSVNEDNILAKMRTYFRNAINREFQAKGISYKQPEERDEDKREYGRWLESHTNQNKLLERLKKDSEFGGDELKLYLCLKSLRNVITYGYSVSREISTEIKRLANSSVVDEHIKNKGKTNKGEKGKEKPKEGDTS